MQTDIPIPTTINGSTTLCELEKLIDAYQLTFTAMPYMRGRMIVCVSGGGNGRMGNAPTLAGALALALGSWCRAAGDALVEEPVIEDGRPSRRREPTAPMRMRRVSPVALPPVPVTRDSSAELMEGSGDFYIPIAPADEALTEAVPLVEPHEL